MTPYVVAGCCIPNGRSLDLVTAQVRALGEQTRRPDALLYVTYGEVPDGVDPQASASAIMEAAAQAFTNMAGREPTEPWLQRVYIAQWDGEMEITDDDTGPGATNHSDYVQVRQFFASVLLEQFPEATHFWHTTPPVWVEGKSPPYPDSYFPASDYLSTALAEGYAAHRSRGGCLCTRANLIESGDIYLACS